ncbi:MAG: cellobiose phosphorylase [Deltaproteobacteria bacterium]|nr:cellobiose phosphorylase [Deltaproteobacteria bacterium]
MTATAAAEVAGDALDLAAAELARSHALAAGPPSPAPSWTSVATAADWLVHVRAELADPESRVAKAAEWLLDNEYLVHRALRQIGQDLPEGFYRQLPALVSSEGEAPPRILVVARGLMEASHLQLSLRAVTGFVEAYQRVSSFDMAELWALPTALRLACLEVLVASLGRLVPSLDMPFEVQGAPAPLIDETECIARALGNLRVIAAISWEDFFQDVSRIEAILRSDPAGVYARMDFETADRYRDVVERLARGSTHSEIEVAERVVAFAQRFAASDPRRSHVGYWLVDTGQEEFESSLGFRLPVATGLARWLARRTTRAYALALGGATAAVLVIPAWHLAQLEAPLWAWPAALIAAGIPASVFGITLVHWIVTQWIPPSVLPKLDFAEGIPDECRTAVAVPCLAGSVEEARELLETLESHYLGSPEPAAEFVLLSDFPDAPSREDPRDGEILDALVEGVARLNRRYSDAEAGPFHLLHRPRLYNPAEGCWMAWERKRGKLEDFNRLLRGEPAPAFSVHAGDEARLRGIRFVVTLDADTILPRGTLQRLVGILAHPLNRPRFDEQGRVVAGYTIVQPRVEIDPAAGNRSRFTRLFGGDTAIDIYSRAVSDVYQDLFGTGIYVGKGIYDVDAFRRSLEGRVPENALASHDLFEGIHGRVALATDVLLYESFPRRYLEFTRRLHRWVRGDWQLLPWLRRQVPGPHGERIESRLLAIDRWKILDNLRRSLVAPSLVAMLAVGWLVVPANPWLWTLLGVLAPAGHLFTDLVTGLARGSRRSGMRSTLLRLRAHAGRWTMLVVFLPYEAWVALDAVVRTWTRVYVTKRGLLEWTSAAHTAQQLGGPPRRGVEWRVMWAGPAAALLLGAALGWIRPESLASAAPLLLAWLLSPEIAHRLGLDGRRPEAEHSERDRRFLRQLARRTWLFFERWAGPDDQWLPPDNYQEDPGAVVAHRTSPTNVGMMLLSSLSAWDLGYVSTDELASLLENTLETVGRLERYRGHLLNWYDTRSLEPLAPRYVSTVDSGNLAASLLALEVGCSEIAEGPIFGAARWDGLVDALDLLEIDLERLGAEPRRKALVQRLGAMIERAEKVRDQPSAWAEALEILEHEECPAFERELSEALEQTQEELGLDLLRDVRVWMDRARHQIGEMRREIGTYAPWLPLLSSPPAPHSGLAAELRALLPPSLALSEIPCRFEKARACVASQVDEGSGKWLEELGASLERGEDAARALRDELLECAARAQKVALAMDFRWLYDDQTRLFHIGYNVSADRIDPHHYDLLASEARIGSFVAIAKGDVPIEHWFRLGRSVTRAGGELCLVSWGGSMFEYLMPSLLLRSEPGTLLAQSERAATHAQRSFAQAQQVPWGVSESGFASLDADGNYRYRAFGVEGLGLRRGLSEDRVVAPYASVLALGCQPVAALENLRRLAELGLIGEFGFYEAADFTPERVPEGRKLTVVRSYMAHHQGMILAALDNALCDGALLRRMRGDPRVRSVELLLHERVPMDRPLEIPAQLEPTTARTPVASLPALPAWSPHREPGASLHRLGNGRLSSAITDGGAGGLSWQEHALTRWTPDPTRNDQGFWTWVMDEETGEKWNAVPTPSGGFESGVVFSPHLVEFHGREHGIGLSMDVAVAPADDVEIRRFSLVNETSSPRTLTLTTCAEIVLAPARDDERHPAFSKLFVRSEWLPGLAGLLFTRRPRGAEERPPVLLQRLVADDPGISLLGYEADRRAFLGRGRDLRNPEGRVRSSASSTGFTLDAVASLCVRVELDPGQTRRFALVTLVGGSHETVLDTAERYQTPSALDWVIADAATEASRGLLRLGLEGGMLPSLQRLASRLVLPHRALRCAPHLFRENRLGQPRLWGLGLSGDLPILLVKISEASDDDLLLDLLRGQRLWREKGLAVDLVVLREGASGYAEPVGDRLMGLLQELGAGEQLGQKGGIHFVAADQVQEEDRRLLHVAARVVLDAARGSLESQLAVAESHASELPRFTPSRREPPSEPTPSLERPADLRFDNGHGGFSPDGKEYVIFLGPGDSTPSPWCNVLANEEFGCLVSEAGGGYTWAANSAENRLTPWTNDPVSDPVGEALYLRDEETGHVWTPTPAPAGADLSFEVRYAPGSSQWRSHAQGLEQTLRVLVPPDDPVKLVQLRLQNHWDRPRRLTATYYAEWVLGAARSTSAPFLIPSYDAEHRALLVQNPWAPEFGGRVAFLSSSAEPHGLCVDREEFLGRDGSPRAPAALARWGLSGHVDPGGDVCGAFQVHLELAAGEALAVHFVLGQGRDRAHALELVDRWREPTAIEPAIERVEAFWEGLLGRVQVRTPDAETDLMLNRWLLYQTVASRLFARSGFYQSGGAVGFRDQLQDVLGLLHVAPERVRSHLLECAAHQFEEGDVLHWWHPPRGRGVRTRCSDDLLWLPFATATYVEATGDESVLDVSIPFLEGPPLGPDETERYGLFARSAQARSLFEHCERALERGVTSGPGELPLMGSGDWNDGMNRVGERGVGESVWLGWFAIATIRGFSQLCERHGDRELADHWRRRMAELERAVDARGWDGGWYWRAFADDGRAWGSHESEECRIDSIAQSWSVLSGAAPEGRARQALDAAESELVREDDGLVEFLWPPFDATSRDPGYIKAYPPGIRENGGQYSHAAAWLGWGLVELGEPDRAMRILRLLNPIRHAGTREEAERYRVEPYVMAADVASVAPHVGRGGWTWYTGASAWTWRLGVEGILGIRPAPGGVRIEPCLPRSWGRAEAVLRGPAGTLQISIEDPEGVGRGVAEVKIDGEVQPDATVPFPEDGRDCKVCVRLGRTVPG